MIYSTSESVPLIWRQNNKYYEKHERVRTYETLAHYRTVDQKQRISALLFASRIPPDLPRRISGSRDHRMAHSRYRLSYHFYECTCNPSKCLTFTLDECTCKPSKCLTDIYLSARMLPQSAGNFIFIPSCSLKKTSCLLPPISRLVTYAEQD